MSNKILALNRSPRSLVLRSVVCLLAVTIGFCGELFPQGLTFQKSKQIFQDGHKSRQRDVALVLLDDSIVVKERKSNATIATIQNSSVTDLTYELNKNARVAEAILISPLFLLSSKKKHWLTIKYQNEGKTDFVLLELNGKEYLQVIAGLESKTGKEVKRILER